MTWLPSVSTFFSERVRQAEDFFEVRLVDLVRDDRRALRDEGPESARMIDVVVCVDDISDWLVRDEPFGFVDNRARSRLGLRSLDHDDVVLEIDRQGGIRREDEIDPVRQFM